MKFVAPASGPRVADSSDPKGRGPYSKPIGPCEASSAASSAQQNCRMLIQQLGLLLASKRLLQELHALLPRQTSQIRTFLTLLMQLLMEATNFSKKEALKEFACNDVQCARKHQASTN